MQPGEVEVWTAQPDQLGSATCARLVAVLDTDERVHAYRHVHKADRRAYIVAHAMRRMALGLAMARNPADLRFGRGSHGQPVLLDGGTHVPAFSLTRRRGQVACAIGHVDALGIDVEAMTDDFDASLLEPYMSVDKETPLADLDFCIRWTALEAFWKSRGLGLSTAHPRITLRAIQDMDGFDVFFAGCGQSAAMVALRLPVAAGHVLSIACEEVVDIKLIKLDDFAAAPQGVRLQTSQFVRTATARHPKHFKSRTRNAV